MANVVSKGFVLLHLAYKARVLTEYHSHKVKRTTPKVFDAATKTLCMNTKAL